MSVAPQGGRSNQTLSYVTGAKPRRLDVRLAEVDRGTGVLSGTGCGERRRRCSDRLVVFDRSGKVLSVRLVSSSRSQFLDGAWLDVFRRATVPPFTPDMTEQTTTLTGTLTYHLIRR